MENKFPRWFDCVIGQERWLCFKTSDSLPIVYTFDCSFEEKPDLHFRWNKPDSYDWVCDVPVYWIPIDFDQLPQEIKDQCIEYSHDYGELIPFGIEEEI